MKKCLEKVIILPFALFVLLFVTVVNADALELASVDFVATNSNIQNNSSFNEAIVTTVVKPDMWYRTNSGLWYYFENEWTTTRTGWFVDPRDGQTYYLRPENGIMSVGRTNIDGEEYFFNNNKDAESCWFPVGLGFYEKIVSEVPTYGALLKDCKTPDGKMVDKDGKLIK